MNKQYYLIQYQNSNDLNLDYAYARPSTTKQRIEQNILNQMQCDKGYGYKILSHNCFHFTCAYKIPQRDGTAILKVYTPSHTYAFNIGG